MIDVTVDSNPNDCQNTFAYIPDYSQRQLYVYSLNDDKMWSFKHNRFSFDPLSGEFQVAGFQYEWSDALFSGTLGRRQPDGYRMFYFHAMASFSEFAVSTRILQTEEESTKFHANDFQLLAHEFDPETGVIFYTQVNRNAIGCWNPNERLTPANFHILEQNNETMIYPSDLKIDQEGNLWVVTNSMPVFIYGQLDTNEYNFRIWRASTSDLDKNSHC